MCSHKNTSNNSPTRKDLTDLSTIPKRASSKFEGREDV